MILILILISFIYSGTSRNYVKPIVNINQLADEIYYSLGYKIIKTNPDDELNGNVNYRYPNLSISFNVDLSTTEITELDDIINLHVPNNSFNDGNPKSIDDKIPNFLVIKGTISKTIAGANFVELGLRTTIKNEFKCDRILDIFLGFEVSDREKQIIFEIMRSTVGYGINEIQVDKKFIDFPIKNNALYFRNFRIKDRIGKDDVGKFFYYRLIGKIELGSLTSIYRELRVIDYLKSQEVRYEE